MALRKSYPVGFRPKGLVDAFDSTEKFSGACALLNNLVFAPGNPELVVPRPGVTSMTTFSGFSTPGVISVQVTIGNLTYGMISSALNSGKDQPFCWDNNAVAFISISGITNLNTPTTQNTSGAWICPVMTSVGHYLLFTHPGFAGGAVKFGWLDIANPAAPVWNAGDTATNNLPSIPVSVANYNNRAYFACGNLLYYSDVATPLTMTTGTQAVTLGNTSVITALSGLPLQTTSAGIIGALIAFKGTQIWQITGDALLSNLATNYMSLTVGTNSPRSICQCPFGIYFCSPAGPYFLSQAGAVNKLVNNPNQDGEPDILQPFYNCTQETRMAGGYVTGLYRVCMDTIINGIASRNDYWFDEIKRRWSGPHTFSYDCASQSGNSFVLSSNANPANLIQSQVVGSLTSVYTDLGVSYSCTMETSQFPKSQSSDMNMNQIVESQIELSNHSSSLTFNISALDEKNTALSVTNITPVNTGVWGATIWGDGHLWTSAAIQPLTYRIPWNTPLVFKKIQLQVTAPANPSFVIGAFFARYQRTGYMLQS